MKDKYRVSASGLVALIKKLMAHGRITSADLETRKQKAVQRDLAKEAQFLSGLFICPACGHPHPQQFDRCPACGASVEEFSHGDGAMDSITTSGGHIYVEEVEKMARRNEASAAEKKGQADLDLEFDEEDDDGPDEEPTEEDDIVDESGTFDLDDEVEDSRTFVPIDHEEAEEPEQEPQPQASAEPEPEPEGPDKGSAIGSIKSFFSKKFKKK